MIFKDLTTRRSTTFYIFMKRLLRRIECSTYTVDSREVSYGPNSISLPVGERGHYPRRYSVSFPLNRTIGEPLVVVRDLPGSKIRVEIPDWMVNSRRKEGKISRGDDIIQA